MSSGSFGVGRRLCVAQSMSPVGQSQHIGACFHGAATCTSDLNIINVAKPRYTIAFFIEETSQKYRIKMVPICMNGLLANESSYRTEVAVYPIDDIVRRAHPGINDNIAIPLSPL